MKTKLSRYLTPEQEAASEEYCRLFRIWHKSQTPENAKAWRDAYDRFTQTTGGKDFCQLVPLGVW